MTSSRLLVLVVVLGALGGASCGSNAKSTPIVTDQHAKAADDTPTEPDVTARTPPQPEPAPEAPTLRLPRTFMPTGYSARVAIDPAQDGFMGHIDIEADVTAASKVIWLNATALTISKAVLTSAGGQPVELEVIPTEKDFVGFRTPAHDEIPAGHVTLAIDYSGKQDPTDTEGVFHQKEHDDWYAFTQFEATSARRAWPCFDEPDVKVPWQLTIEAPAKLQVVSNTKVESEAQPKDGTTKIVSFARTKPLPSYLVAFAVGPFEFVDAGKTKAGTPMRVITPRGRQAEAKWAAEASLPLLMLLEDYFGIAYPYDKLDLLSIPATVGFGAMENPGLITFASSLLLAKDDEITIGHKRGYAVTVAHEMAHQWFGDLVTMAWWDNIWLNEAFATWMENKIVMEWKPDWDGDVDEVGGKSGAMGGDSLENARKIRQPIASNNDIQNAFDGITYEKGASVIRMFELYVGVETFQKGIRKYLADHSWKNATASDFLAAIGDAAGKDVATPFSTFLDQVGVPLVSFELSCEKGAAPKLALTQTRYLPQASKASAQGHWQIPVCVKYAAGAKDARACTLMTDDKAELVLSDAKTCPAWVLPNAGEMGYYRMDPKGDLLARLLKDGMKKLTLPERVGVLGDVAALVEGGQMPAGDGMALVDTLAKDKNRHIIGASVGIVAGAKEVIPAELRPNYGRFVRKVYQARAKALGWQPKKGEDDETKLLRPTIIALVADEGEDKELVAEGTKLAWAFLDDHKAVSPEMAGLALGIAAKHGDRKLFDRLHADAKKAVERRDRDRLLGAMGGFVDPAIAKDALGLILTDEFDIRDASTILWGTLSDKDTRPLAYAFVKENWDALLKKLPREYAAYLTYVGVAQCDAKVRDEVNDFFKDRIAKLNGGPRIFAQGMEEMDLCIAHREAQRPSISAFLKKY